MTKLKAQETGKPIRNVETMWKRLGSEIITLNRKTHQYHVLNASAAMIFELATGANSLEEIAGKLAAAFKIDIARAIQDTRETISGMEKMGLIAPMRALGYKKPSIKEVTQKDINSAIAEGAVLLCRSLLGA